jgi:O-antigen/teichoic acid export membrane protein
MSEAASLQINRRIVVQSILAHFSGSVIGQVALALTLFLMARSLGPEEYGQYSSAVTLTSFIAVIFNLGLDLWLLHEGGRDAAHIDRLSGSVLVIRFVIGLSWVACFYFLSPLIQSETFALPLLRLGALLAWLNSMYYSMLTAFKAVLKNKISALQEALFNLAIFGLTLLLIVWGLETPEIFLVGRIGLQIIFLAVILFQVKYLLGLRPDRQIIKAALTQFPPYLSSEFLATLFLRMDVLLVAFMLTPTDVGIYSPAVGLVSAFFLVPAAIHVVMIPVLSNLFKDHPQQGWQTAKRSILVLGVVGLGLFILMVILSQWITLLLGQAYAAMEPVLLILSPVVFLHSLTYGVATILVAAKLQARRSIIQLLAVLVDLVANLLLLPRIGVNGAAIAYLISEVVILSGYSWLVYLEYRRTHPRGLA